MQVVILCGGLGTRLREETEFRPKPMVPVGKRPILWHIMRTYAHYGYREFVLCLGYKGDAIKEWFYHYEMHNDDLVVTLGRHKTIEYLHDDAGLDWRITLVDTGDDSLKGARIKRIERFIGGDEFMLTYGDGVADIDLDALVAFHRSHGRIGTVTGVRPPSLFGELHVAGDEVELFSEKPQASAGLISGGFFVFRRGIFDYLTDDEDCDFERGPLEKLASDGQLRVYEHLGQWACMDTFRDVEHLNRLWAERRAFWKVWT